MSSENLQHQKEEEDCIPKDLGPLRLSFPNGDLTVRIYQQDITTVEVDAIVNAANGHLIHGAGLADAIRKASTKSFIEEGYEHVRRHGTIRTGEVYSQKATGKLRAKGVQYVIHAVGPRSPNHSLIECMTLITRTYHNALREAESLKLRTIALPAISSGLYGVPLHACMEGYLGGIKIFCSTNPSHLKEVHLVNIDERTTRFIQQKYASHHVETR